MIILLILSISLSSAALAQDNWKRFHYPEHHFSILAADSLAYISQEAKVAIGDITYHSYSYENPADTANVLYQVEYFEYPEGAVHSDSLELVQLIYDENIKATVKRTFGKVLYDQEVTIQGRPGRLYKIAFKDELATIKTKLLIVDNKYYAISVVGARSLSLNRNVDRFINSFDYVDEF